MIQLEIELIKSSLVEEIHELKEALLSSFVMLASPLFLSVSSLVAVKENAAFFSSRLLCAREEGGRYKAKTEAEEWKREWRRKLNSALVFPPYM